MFDFQIKMSAAAALVKGSLYSVTSVSGKSTTFGVVEC